MTASASTGGMTGLESLEMGAARIQVDDKKIINDFSYTFKRGDRIGLAGKNGTGKSTLLNIITGYLNPEKGKVDVGDTTVYGYYKQGGLAFNEKEYSANQSCQNHCHADNNPESHNHLHPQYKVTL